MKTVVKWASLPVLAGALAAMSYVLPGQASFLSRPSGPRAPDIVLTRTDGARAKLFRVVAPERGALLFLDQKSAESARFRVLARRMRENSARNEGTFACIVPPGGPPPSDAADWWFVDAEGQGAAAYGATKLPVLVSLGPGRAVTERREGLDAAQLEALLQGPTAAASGGGCKSGAPKSGGPAASGGGCKAGAPGSGGPAASGGSLGASQPPGTN